MSDLTETLKSISGHFIKTLSDTSLFLHQEMMQLIVGHLASRQEWTSYCNSKVQSTDSLAGQSIGSTAQDKLCVCV